MTSVVIIIFLALSIVNAIMFAILIVSVLRLRSQNQKADALVDLLKTQVSEIEVIHVKQANILSEFRSGDFTSLGDLGFSKHPEGYDQL